MKLSFKTCTIDDRHALQRLLAELGYPVTVSDLKRNMQEIIARDGVVLLAEENDEIVGSVCVLIDVRLAEGLYAEIASLVVAEKWRGKGIGKALVLEAERWASKSVNRIRVRANELRTSAHTFYKLRGYEYSKTQKVFTKMLSQS